MYRRRRIFPFSRRRLFPIPRLLPTPRKLLKNVYVDATSENLLLTLAIATIIALTLAKQFFLAAFALISLVIGLWFFDAKRKKEAENADVDRYKRLIQKYKDADMVAKIYRHEVWLGQSADQLLDSLGNPAAIDEKKLKTIDRQIWKYNQTGKNRFALRITVDDHIVVAWDRK